MRRGVLSLIETRSDSKSPTVSQKNAGPTGETRLLHEKGSVPKNFASHQHKNFAFLGFTSLVEDPSTFCVALSGVIQNPQIDVTLDFSKPIVGGVENPVLFEGNFGE